MDEFEENDTEGRRERMRPRSSSAVTFLVGAKLVDGSEDNVGTRDASMVGKDDVVGTDVTGASVTSSIDVFCPRVDSGTATDTAITTTMATSNSTPSCQPVMTRDCES